MLRLLQFLTRNRNLLLFLLLELIALRLVVLYNDHQRHVVGDALLEWSSAWHVRRNRFENYFGLPQEIEQLRRQNLVLQQSLDSARKTIELLDALAMRSEKDSMPGLRDSLRTALAYTYLPCRAIQNSTHLKYNYITLDKGSVHGVHEGMGLISPQGVAGRVIRVSEHFSIALSALNMSFKLSVRPEKSNEVGTYEWPGNSPRMGAVTYLPVDSKLEESAPIVTSSHSSVFPEGILVGRVSSVKQDQQRGFSLVSIELATDFKALSNLYLVSPVQRDEINSLLPNPEKR